MNNNFRYQDYNFLNSYNRNIKQLYKDIRLTLFFHSMNHDKVIMHNIQFNNKIITTLKIFLTKSKRFF